MVITRGYPASGKSSWATELAATPGWARVCRDDLRQMMFGLDGQLGSELERAVTVAEHAQVEALLRAGVSVVVDATHLRIRYARAWADLAARAGVDFEVRDFNDVTVAECVRRDHVRGEAGGRSVGERVIRDLAAKFPYDRWGTVGVGKLATAAATLRYLPDRSLPSAYLVDVDGTLATMNGRGPFEWHRVGDDLPVAAVVDLVNDLAGKHRIVVMSGRDSVCRRRTSDWLRRFEVPFDELLMRPEGDNRKDSVVKAELFNRHVADKYHVLGVIDDRLQVCRMWHAMGLPLFRVGDPDADF